MCERHLAYEPYGLVPIIEVGLPAGRQGDLSHKLISKGRDLPQQKAKDRYQEIIGHSGIRY